MNHVLAIDAGTGSVRACVFDTQGTPVAISQRSWEHDPEPGIPGSMSFATDRNWALILEIIHEALAKAEISGSDIAAVSSTSMREGIVLLDSDGHEVGELAPTSMPVLRQRCARWRRTPDSKNASTKEPVRRSH